MELNQLFDNKEEWQRLAFNKIKNRLISAKDNRFIRYENSAENHLVMIYGKTQVGKTSLILNMIGLRNECIQEVYDTLRAKTPRGNSSTSTAIIYARSDREEYGCAFSSSYALSVNDIEYFDKAGMSIRLQQVRQDVENHKANPNNILYIYIPYSYFATDSTKETISIMDMPGIESRNHKEDLHIQSLMMKYLPIASICIIACRSNDIQSLESLMLPNHVQWQRMGHRFLLVVTHAYNDGNTKQYFKMNPFNRKMKFYEYIMDSYQREIKKILGDRNTVAVYPIDVGDTLNMLCTSLEYEEDKKELIQTKEQVLSELRNVIICHKGERLKSALADLKMIVENYGVDEICNIKGEIAGCTNRIRDKYQLIDSTRNYLAYLEGEDGEQAALKMRMSVLLESKSQMIHLELIRNLQAIVDSSTKLLGKDRRGQYLKKDPNKEFLDIICQNIDPKIQKIAESMLNPMKEANLKVEITQGEIIRKIDYECILVRENDLYPPKNGLFSKTEKVYVDQLKNICESIQLDVNRRLAYYAVSFISEIDCAIQKTRAELNRVEQSIANQYKKIQKYYEEISELEQSIQTLQYSKQEIESKKEQDRKTLEMYLDLTKEAFLEQRNVVVDQINTSEIASDKILLILFLGVLDRNYQNVIGDIYDN